MRREIVRAMVCTAAAAMLLTGCKKQQTEETATGTVTESQTGGSEDAGETQSGDTTDTSADATAEPEETTEVTETEAVLGDSITSSTIEIDGHVLQFPLSYQEMMDMGFQYLGNANEKIPANTYIITEYFRLNDSKYMCYAMNFDIGEHPVSSCYIVGMTFDNTSIENPDTVINLPGNLTFGQATKEDVEAAYGDPTDTETSDTLEKYKYIQSTYSYGYLTFDTEQDGVINCVDLLNIVKPADFKESEVGDIEPDIYYTYAEPEGLSDNLFDYTVSYDGKVYKLPAPVTAFIADGWTINEAESEDVIPGGTYGNICLEKGDYTLTAEVQNYSNDPVNIRYCYVTELTADNGDGAIALECTGGIKPGMSETDLLAQLTALAVTYETDTDEGTTTYTVTDPEELVYEYDFMVKDGTLVNVDVNCEPTVNDYREAMGLQDDYE